MNTLNTASYLLRLDDDWEIDYQRRELIRHHKTLRSQLFKISGSKCPISFDDLESIRTTFIEMKNGAKKVEKDEWRAVALPAEELSHVKSSSKPMRISGPSDEVKPEYSL